MTSQDAFYDWLFVASIVVGSVCLAVFAVIALVALVLMLRGKQ